MKGLSLPSAKTAVWAALAGFALLTAVGGSVGLAQSQADHVPVPITTATLMVAVINPAVNPIWELSYADSLSDEDWERLDQAATQLAVAASALSLGGNDAAQQGWLNLPAWQQSSQRVSELAMTARNAVLAKDQMQLQTAGDTLVEVCETCHMATLPMP